MATAYKIETDRLIIRCYEPDDAAMLKKSIDESLDHLKPWMPWTNHEPETVERKAERLRYFRAQFDADQDYTFGIFNKTETEILGSSGLHTRVGTGAREIGYWINVNHVGKGYAIEAVSALVKVGFETEELDRIEIRCDPQNVSSSKIPARLGFVHEATLARRVKDAQGNFRDTMIWTMFKDQYQQSALTTFPVKAFDVRNIRIL